MEACDAAGAGSEVSDGGGGVAATRLKSEVPIARATNVADGGPISNTAYTINIQETPTRLRGTTHLPILACQLRQCLFKQPFPRANAFEFGHAALVFALCPLQDEVKVLVFFFEGLDRFEGGSGGELGLEGEDGGLELACASVGGE